MFWPLTTEYEKVLESHPFKRKVKELYPIKIKPRAMFIYNILTVEAMMKYKILRENMSYKQMTQNKCLDITKS